jgi:hypothetical protein
MPHFEKHFSVEEANNLLPELRQLLERIQEVRHSLNISWEQAQPVLTAASQNGGGKEASGYISDLARLNAVLQQFQRQGVVIKDFDRGLVDFPHWREGREVFLCWEQSEDQVRFWHELESGYAAREPI